MKRFKVTEVVEKHFFIKAETKEDAIKVISTWGHRPLPHKTEVKSVTAKEVF